MQSESQSWETNTLSLFAFRQGDSSEKPDEKR